MDSHTHTLLLTHQKMKYCYHIWTGAPWSSFSKLLMQFCRRWYIFYTIVSIPKMQCYKQTATLQFHSLVPPTQNFTTRTHFATSTWLNRHHSLCINCVKKDFPLWKLVPKNTIFRKRFLHRCLSKTTILTWVNYYLANLST